MDRRIGGRLGVVATKSSDKEIQMIVYNYNETDDNFAVSDQVIINISGITDGIYSIEGYSLDRENNNTYRAWEKQGSPKKSGEADMTNLKKSAELSVTTTTQKQTDNGRMELELSLPRHSMVLIKLFTP